MRFLGRREHIAHPIQIADQILGENQSVPQKVNGVLRMEYLRSDIEEQLSYYNSQKTNLLGLRISKDNIFITKLKGFLLNSDAVAFTIDNGLLIFINILLEERLLLQPETPSSNVYKHLLEKSKTLKIIIDLKDIDVLTHDLLCKLCAHPDLPYEKYYDILIKSTIFNQTNWVTLTKTGVVSTSHSETSNENMHYRSGNARDKLCRTTEKLRDINTTIDSMEALSNCNLDWMRLDNPIGTNKPTRKVPLPEPLNPKQLIGVLWLFEKCCDLNVLNQKTFDYIVQHAELFLSESAKSSGLMCDTPEKIKSFFNTIEQHHEQVKKQALDIVRQIAEQQKILDELDTEVDRTIAALKEDGEHAQPLPENRCIIC